ncbi:hypothetical protein TTHERM_00138120 (macronuclear) [Tetrahymena thermophila SB210]|uniref:Uncharacterized protein n=1 Tax=Tetrahymena thermophila (strain SB210) TaxID=312017 RepID=I7M8S0_TETTS|nr:hypothetical protein TTHERM_00138120 [Tetrahymena thermophila SB210]EAR99549.1 hypothetical protein TTHERM_00138120 [Tetrahymena thermophila SB210]|eukprot:XP_001019794.1 hypothetical protein TTHERM_00138120 [Tetrahymena thermophila SB210]
MINIFNFVKKNDKEQFKYCCSEMNQILIIHTQKLDDLRETLYGCIKQKSKKLEDSQLQDDIALLNGLIQIIKCPKKRYIFSCTIDCLKKYKEDFNYIDDVIQNNLKKMTTNQMRKFSTNMKMYENVIYKRDILNKFYNSLDDLDSPVKVKQEIFTF